MVKPWEPKPKQNPFVRGRPSSKEESLKRAIFREIMQELHTDGALRDIVRRELEALPPWTPFENVTQHLSSPLARSMGISGPETIIKVQQMLGAAGEDGKVEAFQNSRYFVLKTKQDGGGFTLSIRTLQRDARHDWREFQLIKNELCGPEYEAIEVYPRESRLVDTSNQFYIHVLPEGMQVPVGFDERLIVRPSTLDTVAGAVQRPWESGMEPPDAQDSVLGLEKRIYEKASQQNEQQRKEGK